VAWANVRVAGSEIGRIGPGLLALVGVASGDDEPTVDYLAAKLLGLRIFDDNSGRMNLSVQEVGGSILVVSQFTLLGECRRGRRPSFTGAAEPLLAKRLYERLGAQLALSVPVSYGCFGAQMEVSLLNDGPVTFILEKSPSDPA
jgi:D-tyrosyl-tRNA(Tyr) deacylase